MRTTLLLLAVLLGVPAFARAEDEAPLPGFEDAVAAVAAGRPLPALGVDEAAASRLRARLADPASSDRERAVALALLGTVAPPEVVARVDELFARARERPDGFAPHVPQPPESFLAAVLGEDGAGLGPAHLPRLACLALRERERLAVAALGWIPGRDALVVTLAFEPGARNPVDGPRLFSLRTRAERFPAERVAMLAEARARPPLDPARSLLLMALLDHDVEGHAAALIGSLEAAADGAEAPGPATVTLLKALAGNRHVLPRREVVPPPAVCGPALAHLALRWPDLFPVLETLLQSTAAPLPKADLWSLVGTGEHARQRAVIALLLPRLDATDEGPLLASLAPPRWNEGSFFLRLALVVEGPDALLTAPVHDALWAVATSVDRAGGRGGPDLAATGAIEALARYRDPADTPRLDGYLADGSIGAASEALRELLRRSEDPAGLLLRILDDEDPGRRETAETAVLIDFQSSPRVPVPRTIEVWRRIAEVLEQGILAGDLGRRDMRLQALWGVTVPGPLSPMRDRTPEDDLALVTFCERLLETGPPRARRWVASCLGWSRRAEALAVLEGLAADEDPRVAEVAAASAIQVRAALGR